MKVSITLRVSFANDERYKEFIKTIVHSLEPDNLQAPKTVRISMRYADNELVAAIESEDLGEAFYSIDDILMMLQMLFLTKDVLVDVGTKTGDNDKGTCE